MPKINTALLVEMSPPHGRNLMRNFIILRTLHFFPAKGTDISQIKKISTIFSTFTEQPSSGGTGFPSLVSWKTTKNHHAVPLKLDWASGDDQEYQTGRISKKENGS